MQTFCRFAPTLAVPALLAATLFASPLCAQTESFVILGDDVFDYFGQTVDGGADIDGDGVPDVIVGGYRGTSISGRIKVVSGATGALIHHIIGGDHEAIGYGVAFVDDVNQDGVPDFIASSLGHETKVFSGQDASLLLTLPLTEGNIAGVSGFPDQNSDGIPEVRSGNRIFSGADGSLLRTLVFTGDFLVMAGDIDGDGTEDYMDQAPQASKVTVRSGVDGSDIYHFTGLYLAKANGVGDVNGDGRDDFVVYWDQGGIGGWSAEVRSGADNSVVYRYENLTIVGATGGGATSIAGMGDVNADGFADFVLAADPLRLYSGATGCVLAQFVQSGAFFPTGFSVANAGDVDGDGDNDLIAGNAEPSGPNSEGTAVLFTFDGPLGQNYCQSLANSTGQAARISANGSTGISQNNMILVATDLPAGKPGIFFYGDAQVLLPFGDGLRCVGAGSQGLFRLPATLSDLNGCLTHELDITSPPFGAGQILPGSQWNFQAWFRDLAAGGAGFNLSDGLSVFFLP